MVTKMAAMSIYGEATPYLIRSQQLMTSKMSAMWTSRLLKCHLSRLCQGNLLRRSLSRLRQKKELYFDKQKRLVKQNYFVLEFTRTYCEHGEARKRLNEEVQVMDSAQLLKMARQIRDQAGKLDKMALSVPLSHITQPLKTLIDNGFDEEECLCLASNPVIVKNISNFTHSFSTFMQYGFEGKTVTEMFRKVPELITLQEHQLHGVFVSLRGMGFTDGLLGSIVSQVPDILLKDLKNVSSRFSVLKAYFKSPDVFKILENFPGVLKEDLDELDEKIMYAKTKMDATNRQIMNSNFFQHSLVYIRTRHTFVVRAGFFRSSEKKEIHFENPLLRDILDTSDEEFAKMFGNMSLTDYTTFTKLFENEEKDDIDQMKTEVQRDDLSDTE